VDGIDAGDLEKITDTDAFDDYVQENDYNSIEKDTDEKFGPEIEGDTNQDYPKQSYSYWDGSSLVVVCGIWPDHDIRGIGGEKDQQGNDSKDLDDGDSDSGENLHEFDDPQTDNPDDFI